MADGLIKYDSSAKSLILPNIGQFTKTFNQERNDNFSAAGKAEHINIREWDEIAFTVRHLEKNETYKFYDFWSFARLGNTFSFALYSSEAETTILSSGVAAGQTVIKTTGTANFSINEWCFIGQSTGNRYEVVQLSSITAGVSLKATTNLKNAYTTGDEFRHIDYYHTMSVKDKKLSVPADAPGKHHTVRLRLIEEK